LGFPHEQFDAHADLNAEDVLRRAGELAGLFATRFAKEKG
jgi:hypothetical protein